RLVVPRPPRRQRRVEVQVAIDQRRRRQPPVRLDHLPGVGVEVGPDPDEAPAPDRDVDDAVADAYVPNEEVHRVTVLRVPEPPYRPLDARVIPRFAGIRTFMRAPHVTDLRGVDVAVFGIPFDTATTYRAGPRFGPEAIRSASALLRPYHPVLDVNVVETL